MIRLSFIVVSIFALGTLAGCASSDVSERRSYAGDEEIARPSRIIVHSFAATADDVPSDSAVEGYYERRDTPQTAEEVALGRQLGDQVAVQLVEEILDLGFPAELAGKGPAPQAGNLVIKGQFVSIDEGSRLKRMLIGFGAGAAELKTFVEGYLVTEGGLRPLGSAEIEAGGGKMPGMLVPVGIGAAAGRAGTAAAVSGGLNVAQELTSEGIHHAAERTAEEIAELLEEAFKKRGWM